MKQEESCSIFKAEFDPDSKTLFQSKNTLVIKWNYKVLGKLPCFNISLLYLEWHTFALLVVLRIHIKILQNKPFKVAQMTQQVNMLFSKLRILCLILGSCGKKEPALTNWWLTSTPVYSYVSMCMHTIAHAQMHIISEHI